jgi:hypothetical protein
MNKCRTFRRRKIPLFAENIDRLWAGVRAAACRFLTSVPGRIEFARLHPCGMNFVAPRCCFFMRQCKSTILNAVLECRFQTNSRSEAIHAELFDTYFERKKSSDKSADKPETEKELLRDIKGYIHGTKDGKVVIENIKPKLTGGVHRVLSEIKSEKFYINYSYSSKSLKG